MNMEVHSKVFGGRFKYKWCILFCTVLSVSMIKVLVTAEEVDYNGYIVYCPCMGKMLVLADYFVRICRGYVIKSNDRVCIH
jgi:hypothetical protein